MDISTSNKSITVTSSSVIIVFLSKENQQHEPHIIYITFNDDNVPGSPFVVNLSDIEEKEDDYDRTTRDGNTLVRSRNVHIPPTGEVDNRQSHQLQDANKNITKATSMMHDNMSSSHNFYSNTTTSSTSMLKNTKMSRNDYENIYYQKGSSRY
jgi:hypothetical protein